MSIVDKTRQLGRRLRHHMQSTLTFTVGSKATDGGATKLVSHSDLTECISHASPLQEAVDRIIGDGVVLSATHFSGRKIPHASLTPPTPHHFTWNKRTQKCRCIA